MDSWAGRRLVLLTEQTSKSRRYDNKILGLNFQDNDWLSAYPFFFLREVPLSRYSFFIKLENRKLLLTLAVQRYYFCPTIPFLFVFVFFLAPEIGISFQVKSPVRTKALDESCPIYPFKEGIRVRPLSSTFWLTGDLPCKISFLSLLSGYPGM